MGIFSQLENRVYLLYRYLKMWDLNVVLMITLSLSSLLSIYLSICLSIHYLTISLYLCIVILFQAVWEKVVSFLKFKANPSSCIFEKRFLVSIPLLIK